MIQVFKPSYTDEEWYAVREVLASGWIGLGPKTREFEQRFAEYVGAKYAVATNSATAALHLAIVAYGIGPGDEVLVPTMTFVSTAHAVLYNGTTPVFIDCERDTLNISVEDIARKITSRTRAVIPMHYGGYPCRMDEIFQLAKQHGLLVIEDAAHACGSTYKGQKIGGLPSDASCFSFHAVKNLATGDGGMITTNSIGVFNTLKRLRWVGIDKDTWSRTKLIEGERKTGIRQYASYGWYYEVHDLGYKYHMNDITAAIGLVQLRKLDWMNERRRQLVQRYNAAFEDVKWIERPVENGYDRSACHNYVIKTRFRDELNLYLKEKNVATGVHYMPIHLQPYYRKKFQTELPVAENVWRRILTLPLYPDLTDEDFDYVVESIRSFNREVVRRKRQKSI